MHSVPTTITFRPRSLVSLPNSRVNEPNVGRFCVIDFFTHLSKSLQICLQNTSWKMRPAVKSLQFKISQCFFFCYFDNETLQEGDCSTWHPYFYFTKLMNPAWCIETYSLRSCDYEIVLLKVWASLRKHLELLQYFETADPPDKEMYTEGPSTFHI